MLGTFSPRAECVEGGFGSGALTMALLAGRGAGRRVTSTKSDLGRRRSLWSDTPLMPEGATSTFREGDVYELLEERGIDRLCWTCRSRAR